MKLRQKITYSIGNFSQTLAYQAFSNRIQFYYIDVLGLGAGLVGIIWFFFGFWNAINDPLMGQVSDRTRTRWGRRIPYLFFGAIPLGVSFFLLWTPPANSVASAIYFVVMLFVFDTIISLLTMALNALFPEITADLNERSSLSAYREAGAVIALLLAFILAPILSDELGWWQMGAIIGAITAIGYLLCVIDNKEDPASMTGEGLGLGESLRITLRNRSFRWFLGANLAKEYIFLILAATIPFWRKYCLGITGPSEVFGIMMGPGDQEAILLGTAFVLAVPFLAMWNRIMARIGVRKMWIICFLLFIPGLALLFFANNFYIGLLSTTLVSPALSGSMMVYTVMLSEIIDIDAKHTGLRREGIYFGINGGVTKLVFTIQGLLYAIVLPFSKYDAALSVQPMSAIWGIRFLIAGTPIIACLIGLFFLRYDHLAQNDKQQITGEMVAV